MRGGKRAGGSAGQRRERSCSPLPVPCPRGVTGRATGGRWARPGPLPSIPGLCPLRSGRGKRRGGLTNARPLALKIHAEQLFLLGACSWMRLRSGSRGAERGGKRLRGDLTTPNPLGNHRQELSRRLGQVGSVPAAAPRGGCGSIPGKEEEDAGCSSLPAPSASRRTGFFSAPFARGWSCCLIVFGNKLLVPALGSPAAQNSCCKSGRLVQVEFNGNLLPRALHAH